MADGRWQMGRVSPISDLPSPISYNRCSTIGPSASAGMKVSAPTMITTLISMTTNSGVCVGRVPEPVLDQDDQRRPLPLLGLDLPAQVLGRASHHPPFLG